MRHKWHRILKDIFVIITKKNDLCAKQVTEQKVYFSAMIEIKKADNLAALEFPGIHVTCRVDNEKVPLTRVQGLLSEKQPQPSIIF